MSAFHVGLKKWVDDSYDIEIGYNLSSKLVEDITGGLVGKIKKFAVITDSNVKELYAKPICKLSFYFLSFINDVWLHEYNI